MYKPYRRTIQLVVFAAMFAIPVLNLFEIYAITGTFYSLNVGGLAMADPSALLQTVFASGEFPSLLLASLWFPLLLALLLGRVWCGWMCPYHLLSDGVVRLRAAIRTRVLGRPQPETRVVSSSFRANAVRFGFLLAGCFLAGAVGIPVLNYVNAPGILSTEAMLLVRERAVSVEFGFIVLLLAMELLLFPRFWCRLFCPTGACLSLLRTPYTLHIRSRTRNPTAACCRNNPCSEECPMFLAPFREGGDLLCTNCARCIDACDGRREKEMLGFRGFSSSGPPETHSGFSPN